MSKRGTVLLLIIMVFSLFFLTAALTGCSRDFEAIDGEEQLQEETTDKGETAMDTNNANRSSAAPPIDLNIPDNLETATLGMG